MSQTGRAEILWGMALLGLLHTRPGCVVHGKVRIGAFGIRSGKEYESSEPYLAVSLTLDPTFEVGYESATQFTKDYA